MGIGEKVSGTFFAPAVHCLSLSDCALWRSMTAETVPDTFSCLEATGKPFKVRIVACMRKLLTILNTIAATGQKWNPKCLNHA